VGKYGKDDKTLDTEKMIFACQIPRARIQTQSHNISRVSLFHGDNAYEYAPQSYVTFVISVTERLAVPVFSS
jgi:hypothetical protein